MNDEFTAYIRKIEKLATECADEDRRLDAVKTLAILCMILCDGWRPDPNGGEVIDLLKWRKAA